MEFALAIWACSALIASIINAYVTCFEDEDGNIYKHSFWTQRRAWRDTSDAFNIVGRIIIVFAITIFIFPSNILMMLVAICIFLGKLFSKLFYKIFRKR